MIAGILGWVGRPELWRPLVFASAVLRVLLVFAPFDVLDPVDPWVLGRHLLDGDVPYRDFGLEYPPAALVAFLAPGAVPHGWASSVLALEMFLLELTLWWAWRGDRAVVQRYLLISLPLVPFLSGGFDAIPMVALAWSTVLLVDGRRTLGWAAAAVGAAVKVFPGVVWGTTRRWGRAGVIALLLVVASLLAPLLLADGVDTPIGYHGERGVQNESVAASLTFVTDMIQGEDTVYAYRFRSNEVDGAGGFVIATLVIFGLAAAGVAVQAWRRDEVGDIPFATLTLLTLVLCASPVLSPQFLLLGAPIAAALSGAAFVRYLPVACLTWLPFLVDNRRSDAFVALASVRNGFLVAFAVWAAAGFLRGLSPQPNLPVTVGPTDLTR